MSDDVLSIVPLRGGVHHGRKHESFPLGHALGRLSELLRASATRAQPRVLSSRLLRTQRRLDIVDNRTLQATGRHHWGRLITKFTRDY